MIASPRLNERTIWSCGLATSVLRMASDLLMVRLPVGNDWEPFCARCGSGWDANFCQQRSGAPPAERRQQIGPPSAEADRYRTANFLGSQRQAECERHIETWMVVLARRNARKVVKAARAIPGSIQRACLSECHRCPPLPGRSEPDSPGPSKAKAAKRGAFVSSKAALTKTWGLRSLEII
jgi:hypothetical protein